MTAHKQVRSTEEALMLAIEALEDYGHAWPHHVVQYTNAITAIKAALEAHKALMSVSDGAQPAVTESHKRKPLTSQERDAQRWRFLMENSYDSESVTQFHVWRHSWEPHSQTGEPTEWKQRVRGIALIYFIDRAIEAKLKAKNERKEKHTRNGGCL